MDITMTVDKARMHGILDHETYFHITRYKETKEDKYFVVQERDVSYRFYTHYHPFVEALERRLRREGLVGLQATDTEYLPDRASLPESIEFTLAPNAEIIIPQGSGVLLAATTQATLADGTPFELAKSMHLVTAIAAEATAPQGLHATLVDGMVRRPGRARCSLCPHSRPSSSRTRSSRSRPRRSWSCSTG